MYGNAIKDNAPAVDIIADFSAIIDLLLFVYLFIHFYCFTI